MFTWGEDELNVVGSIRRLMEEPSLLAASTGSLTQVGAIFRQCNVYFGGDTGSMHVASLVGIPVVAIFGPRDPVVKEPLELHRVIRKEVGYVPAGINFARTSNA